MKSDPAGSESPLHALLAATGATRTGDDSYRADAPDWFGDRVFGGIAAAQAVAAASLTVDAPMRAHSMHAYFLGPMRPGLVDLAVDRLRDGRTFATRHVRSNQDDRTAFWCTVSFHADEPGTSYQLPMPEAPDPESLPTGSDEEGPPPFDCREIGPTSVRDDGTYLSTRRYWVRSHEPMADDPLDHLQAVTFLSDMTGTSFRPHNLGEWGTHTDASIDHAVWFHRPYRADEWIYVDLHALVNEAGRSAMRGQYYDRDGRLCMSMAQELLIRPLPVG